VEWIMDEGVTGGMGPSRGQDFVPDLTPSRLLCPADQPEKAETVVGEAHTMSCFLPMPSVCFLRLNSYCAHIESRGDLHSHRQHPPALGLKELLIIFPTPRALLNILCRIPLSICTACGLTA
jgi:hypothetical protein